MSVKKKIAISVSVILVVAIIVAVIVIAWVMSGLYFAKTGGKMDGVSYEDTRKVFGDDSLFVDEKYFDDIGFEISSAKYSINFSGRNDTLKNNEITGYEDKAKSYNADYSGEYAVNDDWILTEIVIEYNKKADPAFETDEEYDGYDYNLFCEGQMIHLNVIKDGHRLYIGARFDYVLSEGQLPAGPDTEFAKAFSQSLMDKIV